MLGELSKLMQRMDSDLPPLVRKTTEEIGTLDKKVTEIQTEISVKVRIYFKNQKKFDRVQKAKMVQQIKDLFTEAEKLADRKVVLAQGLYDKVDDNIKEMDAADRKLQNEMKQAAEQMQEKLAGLQSPPKKVPTTSRKDSLKRKAPVGNERKAARLAENDAYMKDLQAIPPLAADIEMPIDPNEPIYCFCQTVSFGKMVGCDNSDCPTEWFHFSCVGLTEDPVGKWYCDNCKPLMKKKKG